MSKQTQTDDFERNFEGWLHTAYDAIEPSADFREKLLNQMYPSNDENDQNALPEDPRAHHLRSGWWKPWLTAAAVGAVGITLGAVGIRAATSPPAIGYSPPASQVTASGSVSETKEPATVVPTQADPDAGEQAIGCAAEENIMRLPDATAIGLTVTLAEDEVAVTNNSDQSVTVGGNIGEVVLIDDEGTIVGGTRIHLAVAKVDRTLATGETYRSTYGNVMGPCDWDADNNEMMPDGEYTAVSLLVAVNNAGIGIRYRSEPFPVTVTDSHMHMH